MLVHDYLSFFAREQPDAPCIIVSDQTLSYRQVRARSLRLANALLDAGLEKGDRFGFLDRNSAEGVITYMAGSVAGLVPVPLNWRLAPAEWAYILDDASVSLVICESEFCSGMDSIRGALPNVRQFVSINSAETKGWTSFEDFRAAFPASAPSTTVNDSDVFYQMYTSGTTGRPKGAMLTHYSVVSNAMQNLPYFLSALGPGRKTLIVMPMFHAGAASFVIGSIASGSTMLIHRDFDSHDVVHALTVERINVVNLVPAMIQAMLLQVGDIRQRDFSSLDMLIYGASSISESTLREAIDVFECDFYQGFGQTETSAVISFLTAEDHRIALEKNPGLLMSAGRAVVGTEIRIVNSEDSEMPVGESGEIVMRGPQMMKGYFNMPDATKEAMRGGWLHTGDVGMLDEDGYLYVRDRIKDMIISGGENVYPREVENVLFEHPDIDDVAVIGVPDEKYGEAVTAVVVVREGSTLEAHDVISFCRGKIGGYKIPRRLRTVAELPRNPSGKVLKVELRDRFA